jgi:hypothetical protein
MLILTKKAKCTGTLRECRSKHLPWKITVIAGRSRWTIPSKVARSPAVLAYKIPEKSFKLKWVPFHKRLKDIWTEKSLIFP